ncbi:hypothetical protein N7528_006631 [Penicillium herquei]|nr:hypothetical protein N7528_006631 [Penicillium herquei]
MKEPLITQLSIISLFNSLTSDEKVYAHHLSRAAWAGTRIILSQVSPESPHIFDLIRELYKACGSNWESLLDQTTVSSRPRNESEKYLQEFLRYAATFLSNMGNYYGEGDQKFVPDIPESFLHGISAVSPLAVELCRICAPAICSSTPTHLGFPSTVAQSAYYVGPLQINQDEIGMLTPIFSESNIWPRSSRVSKDTNSTGSAVVFNILQASIEKSESPKPLDQLKNGAAITTVKRDHSLNLEKVNAHIRAARHAATDPLRIEFLDYYEMFFQTGDRKHFDNSQRVWMKDKQPRVETFFGFNHKYRDPAGERAEFQGFVGLPDVEGSKELNALQRDAQRYIATLPRVNGFQGHGGSNGPFELDEFHPPDFNAIHALTYAATNLFTGLSMPAFCDNWKDYAWKKIMVKNRDQAMRVGDPSQGEPAWFIAESERTRYLQHVDHSVTFKVALYELFGHGTGKLLCEYDSDSPKRYNFDIENPPVNPLTRKPISTWYHPGQQTSSVFGELDMSLEECRAEAIAAYLTFDEGILSTLGYSDTSEITADDIIYNVYLAFGQLGIAALNSYQPEDKKWSSTHDRARFGIVRTLVATNNFMKVDYDDASSPPRVTVSIDRVRLLKTARPTIASLMTKLHVWRCSADASAAIEFYSELTNVDEFWLRVRDVAVAKVKNQAPRLFVQANTILEDDVQNENGTPRVRIVEYDTTVEGVIQSWCDRVV